MSPPLHFQTVQSPGASPTQWIFFLHGFFGQGRNWATIANRVVKERPDWGGVLVDLRLHGGSLGFQPPHTLESCAEDVWRVMRKFGSAEHVLLGHSFGGKVALKVVSQPSDPIRQVWVLDANPGPLAGLGEISQLLSALKVLSGPFPSVADAVDGFKRMGFSKRVSRWIVGQLYLGEGGFHWPFVVEDMESFFEDYVQADLRSVLEHHAQGGPEIHIIRAIESIILSEETTRWIAETSAMNPRLHLHRIHGGHWIHVDNPKGVIGLLASALP